MTKLVVQAVAAALLLSIILIGLLAFGGKPIPDVLQNVAVGCLTGLVGLLVPSAAGSERGRHRADVAD